MQQISFEWDDFPVFLRSPAACARAVERGQLQPDTSIIVYSERGERARMIAADHSPLKPLFGHDDPPQAPASASATCESAGADDVMRESEATAGYDGNPEFPWGKGTLTPDPAAIAHPVVADGHGDAGSRAAPVRVPTAFLDWAVMPYRRYADFTGRARRREYWSFVVLAIGIVCGLGMAGGFQFRGVGGGLLTLFLVASFIPSLSVQVRRLHDRDLSGWLVLVGLIPYVGGPIVLILMLLEGTAGRNRFGPDPKRG